MAVEVIASHIQRLFCTWQDFNQHVLVVVPLVVTMFLVFSMVMLLTVIIMVLVAIGEMNLTTDFLQMEVSIHVVLQPEYAFAALVRSKNDITPCFPLSIGKESETTILIAPQLLHDLIAFQNEPLPHQLLEEGRSMIGMTCRDRRHTIRQRMRIKD